MTDHRLPTSAAALLVTLAAFSSAIATEPDPVVHPNGIDPAVSVEIDRICQGLVDDAHTPGAVVAVGRCSPDGRDVTLHERAYGTRDGREPMTVDTLFDLASLTKPSFTTVAVMLLAEDGKLSVDDPVADHLPGFERNGKGDVRIRHLLTHTSGLPAYTGTDGLPPRPDPDALIERICALKPRAAPDEKCIYSCLNFILLAQIAENAGGEDLTSFLRRRIWGPIGMTDATHFPSPEQLARCAPTLRAASRRGRVHDPLAWYYTDYAGRGHACGNAGGFATVPDLARLARLLLHDGVLEGRRIFAADTVEQMTTRQTEAARRTFGWGIYRAGSYATPRNQTPATACIGHTGFTGTFVWIDKLSRTWAVLFTNCVYPSVDDDRPSTIAERRAAVARARARLTRTLLDHLDIYTP